MSDNIKDFGNSNIKLSRLDILKLCLVSELALLAIYFLWVIIFKNLNYFDLSSFHDLNNILFGILAAFPVLFVNLVIPKYFGGVLKSLFSENITWQFLDFKQNVVSPLVKALDTPSALVVSILAGTCEEFFFRDLLLEETGILVSSALFALLHFGTQAKKYYAVALIYFIYGIYFALLKQYFGNMAVPVICHIVYDFLIIFFMNKKLT